MLILNIFNIILDIMIIFKNMHKKRYNVNYITLFCVIVNTKNTIKLIIKLTLKLIYIYY